MAVSQEFLQGMMDSFTAKDFDGFREYLADDFTWLKPDGSVFMAGADEFIVEVKKYFAANPNTSSVLSPFIVIGNLATQTEVMSGLADGTTEEYLWVYEFEGDKLAKQWGFIPAK